MSLINELTVVLVSKLLLCKRIKTLSQVLLYLHIRKHHSTLSCSIPYLKSIKWVSMARPLPSATVHTLIKHPLSKYLSSSNSSSIRPLLNSYCPSYNSPEGDFGCRIVHALTLLRLKGTLYVKSMWFAVCSQSATGGEI